MKFLSSNSRAAKSGRPRLEIERTRFEYGLEVLAAAGFLFGIFNLIINYPALPNSIPVHFNFKGEVDSWGGKESIWLLVAVEVVIYASMSLITRFPHICNYPYKITPENAERQYRLGRSFITLLKTEIVWLFSAIISETIDTALGKSSQMQPTMFYAFITIIIGSTIGYFVAAYRAR